jgi:integrase
MTRSIYQQVRHAVDSPKISRLGESKRAARMDGSKKSTDIFSKRDRDQLLSFARGFDGWRHDQGLGNVMVRELDQHELYSYIDYKIDRGDWRAVRTVNDAIRRADKLGDICATVYGYQAPEHLKPYTYDDLRGRGLADKVRQNPMERRDYELLRQAYQTNPYLSRGAAQAVELAGRFGLRLAECAGLRVSDFEAVGLPTRGRPHDEQPYIIHVHEGAKNGRIREFRTRKEDWPYIIDLKRHMAPDAYICGGIGARAISKSVAGQLERLGLRGRYPREPMHAIRKMYARERFAEEKAKGLSDRVAWDTVSSELGHGSGRSDLFEVYVKGE